MFEINVERKKGRLDKLFIILVARIYREKIGDFPMVTVILVIFESRRLDDMFRSSCHVFRIIRHPVRISEIVGGRLAKFVPVPVFFPIGRLNEKIFFRPSFTT